MAIVSFLILIGPAALTWKLCEIFCPLETERTGRTLITLIADSLWILAGACLVLRVVFSVGTVSFSPVYTPEAEKTLFMVPFVWKYTAVSSVLAGLLALIKISIRKIRTRKRKRR